MAFNQNEKINKADKLSLQISGTANDSPGAKFWFNEDRGVAFITPPEKVWLDFSSIPGASNSAAADANALANPTIIERKVQRLTLDPTSTDRSYEARSVFGDLTSSNMENWIPPTLIRNSGSASFGYAIRLFYGDPDGGGTEIFTTAQPGPGGAPSWQADYSAGLLGISTDETAYYKNLYDTNGLWFLGYRYIGPVVGGVPNAELEYSGITSQTTVDSFLTRSGFSVRAWSLVAKSGSNVYSATVKVSHDGTSTTDAAETDISFESVLRIPSSGDIDGLFIDKQLIGIGATQSLELTVTSTDTVDIKLRRLPDMSLGVFT